MSPYIRMEKIENIIVSTHDSIYPVKGGVNNLDYHQKERRLQMIIHFADKWTAAVEEERRT